MNAGAIESALHRAAWGPFFTQADLAHRAALLLRGLCQDHPFVDGNKRTALAVTDFFLGLNGQLVKGSEDDEIALMLDVAQDRLSVDDIARWIRARARKG